MSKKTREWNKSLYKNQSYTDPISNISYDLSHLSNQTVKLNYEFKDDKKEKVKGTIDVNLVFDNHCYTREIKSEENIEVLVSEKFNEKIQKRCFDLERYEFSKKLPHIIKNLSFKMCMESKDLGKSIRLENPDKNSKGTYIFLKARAYKKSKSLTLYVETAHKRNSIPSKYKMENHPRRYMLILGNLIKNKWDFLIQKSPIK